MIKKDQKINWALGERIYHFCKFREYSVTVLVWDKNLLLRCAKTIQKWIWITCLLSQNTTLTKHHIIWLSDKTSPDSHKRSSLDDNNICKYLNSKFLWCFNGCRLRNVPTILIMMRTTDKVISSGATIMQTKVSNWNNRKNYLHK